MSAISDEDVDVLVVGAGVAGLFVAWRLLGQDAVQPPRVVVLESAGRVGGRIQTVEVPDRPDQRIDLGAMRFTSEHTLVQSLLTRLGIGHLPTTPTDLGQNLSYLRGKRFRTAELSDVATPVPYGLEAHERGMNPDEMFDWVITRALAEEGWPVPNDRQSWNAFKETFVFRGRPLDDLGFWNIADEFLSAEAYAYLRDANGYDCNNWAAGEVMQTQLAGFGKEVTYSRIAGGAGTVVDTLARELTAAGGQVRTDHCVTGIEGPDTSGLLTVHVRTGTGERIIRTRKLVLAVPQRALWLMDSHGLLFGRPGVRRALESVVTQPAVRIMLGFAEPWWEAPPLNIRGGRSLTDLPIRQVYYLDRYDEREDAVLSVMCNDDRAYDYFLPLPDHAEMSGDDPDVRRIMRQTVRQLSLLHGVPVPEPRWVAVRDWVADPFGGAYHGWRPGRRCWEAAALIRQPLEDIEVFICGAAYSDLPTWMEGALGNAELLLQSRFGLAAPTWLPPATYLGW
jgi:monoamine oxidase